MNSSLTATVAVAAATVMLLSGGCGKKSQDEPGGQAGQTHETGQSGQPAASLSTEGVPFESTIEGAGYEVVYYNEFPSPVAGHKGRMILYQSASGGKDGGMVFVEQVGQVAYWGWHWYFKDAKPKSYERLDINKDGLWDVRVFAEGDRNFDLIQDQDFLLTDHDREDRIALNGTSSQVVEDHALWRCFDGDVRSSWMSPMEGGERPYIELASPLGIADGILEIRAWKEDQPRECELYADGKKVQSFELAATTDEQLVQLDPSVREAKKIRLEIKSCHGKSAAAAVAEMQIR